MIINCPDCNHEVSDHAEHCLNCGCPIAEHKEEHNEEPQVITIEHTKKKYKILHLFSIIIIVFGIIVYAVNYELNPTLGEGTFWVCLIIGAVIAIISKIGTWWDHA